MIQVKIARVNGQQVFYDKFFNLVSGIAGSFCSSNFAGKDWRVQHAACIKEETFVCVWISYDVIDAPLRFIEKAKMVGSYRQAIAGIISTSSTYWLLFIYLFL